MYIQIATGEIFEMYASYITVHLQEYVKQCKGFVKYFGRAVTKVAITCLLKFVWGHVTKWCTLVAEDSEPTLSAPSELLKHINLLSVLLILVTLLMNDLWLHHCYGLWHMKRILDRYRTLRQRLEMYFQPAAGIKWVVQIAISMFTCSILPQARCTVGQCRWNTGRSMLKKAANQYTVTQSLPADIISHRQVIC